MSSSVHHSDKSKPMLSNPDTDKHLKVANDYATKYRRKAGSIVSRHLQGTNFSIDSDGCVVDRFGTTKADPILFLSSSAATLLGIPDLTKHFNKIKV